ncbi:MAG: acyltransferase [Eubacteriales bacterium]
MFKIKVNMKNYIINSSLLFIICFFYNLIHKNKYKFNGKNNLISKKNCFLKKSKANIIGNNNHIIIHRNVRLNNCSIFISGNNNIIEIYDNCCLNTTEFWIEDDSCNIVLNKNITINGTTQLAVMEGKKIIINEDCMFSSDIVLRTGDSHSIVDIYGNRINPSDDIIIGKHCWLGAKTSILKGVKLPPNTIVGLGSIVTKSFSNENTIIAGNPAKVLKEQINWKRERIQISGH